MNTYITAGGVTREVFVDGDQAPAFTLSLSDLLDPSSIRGTRSSTIRILNTPESRAVLGSEAMMWPIPSDRPIISFKNEGVEVFTSRIIASRWSRDIIECASVGGNANWFDWAKNTKLPDVRISLLDQGIRDDLSPSLTLDIIEDSWTGSGILHFPLIDYGALEDSDATFHIPREGFRPTFRIGQLIKALFRTQGLLVSFTGELNTRLEKMILVPNTARTRSVFDPDLSGYSDLSLVQAGNGAGIQQGSTTYTLTVFGATPNVVTGGTEFFDVNARFDATAHKYETIEDCQLSLRIRFVRLTFANDGTFEGKRFRLNLWDETDDAELAGAWSSPVTADEATAGIKYVHMHTRPEGVLEEHVLYFGLQIDDSSGVSSMSINVNRWDGDGHVNIQYIPDGEYSTRGVPFRLSTALPDWTVIEFLKGVMSHQCMMVDTNSYGEVTFTMIENFLRPNIASSDPGDLRGRIDHTVAPVKIKEQQPVDVQFRWKEDTGDQQLNRINRIVPTPGYANADVHIGGTGNTKKVELPFAPTVMGSVLGGKAVPIMRKEGGDFQVNSFDIVPRLLVVDGVIEGDIIVANDEFSSITLDAYPRTYFLDEGSNVPMSFADRDKHWIPERSRNTTQGVLTAFHSKKIAKDRYGVGWEVMVQWEPTELVDFDFGRPYLCDDGHSQFPAYVSDIKDGRALNRFTKTVLFTLEPNAELVMPRITYCDGALRVSDSGSPEVDGIYCPDGMENDAPVWTKEGGVRLEDSMYYPLYEGDPLGYFVMTSGGTFEDDPANALYSTFDLPSNPAAVWDVFTAFGGGGDTPVPTVTAL